MSLEARGNSSSAAAYPRFGKRRTVLARRASVVDEPIAVEELVRAAQEGAPGVQACPQGSRFAEDHGLALGGEVADEIDGLGLFALLRITAPPFRTPEPH